MPSQLDLFGFVQQAQQFLSVGIQQFWAHQRDFLSCIRRPHPDNRTFITKIFEEFSEMLWVAQYQLLDLVRSPNRTPVSAFEHDGNVGAAFLISTPAHG